jgi:hypothetical protein
MSENRTAIIAKLVKVAKKHYPAVSPPAGRTVLENLLYACLLENAQFTAADEAFARLEQYSDWNEVRVTTNQELCEAASALGDALPAIEHLKQVLHSLFETHYSFDLDFLIKENQGKAIAQLEKYKGVTPFVVAYLVQNSLGGHKIPTSEASFDFAEAIGLVTPKEKESGTVPGFERAVPKAKGPEFFSTMHQLAVDFKNKPRDKHIIAILKEINPDAVKRMEAADAAAKKNAAQAAPEVKPAAANSSSGKGAAPKVTVPGPAKSLPVEAKPLVDSNKSSPDPKAVTSDKKNVAAKPTVPGKAASTDKKSSGPEAAKGKSVTSPSAPTSKSSNGDKKAVPPAKAQATKPVEKPNAKPNSKPVPKKPEPSPPAKAGKTGPVAGVGNKKPAPAKPTAAKKKPR